MKNLLLVSLLGFTALISVAVGVELGPEPVYRGKLKDLAPAPHLLGKKWVDATGLVIEDFTDLKSYPAEVRPLVEGLKEQLEPLGVRKAADFSFRVPDEPWHYVTLRVFVFETSQACVQWWEKKYRHDGWEKFYKPVEGVAYTAVDSTETPKRAVAIGNVWMTCHALKDRDNHVAVIDACVEKLLEATKPD